MACHGVVFACGGCCRDVWLCSWLRRAREHGPERRRSGEALGAWPDSGWDLAVACAGRVCLLLGREGRVRAMRRYLLVAAVMAAATTLTGSATAGAAAPAVRAQPGARLWVARYDDGSGGYDAAHAMAVSPDGSTVFVTGDSWPAGPTGRDYATVAYSAATGTQLWVSRYSGPGPRTDAWSVAVSPGGGRVFVTGGARG